MKISIELDGHKYTFAFKNVKEVSDIGWNKCYYTPIILDEEGKEILELPETKSGGCSHEHYFTLFNAYVDMLKELLKWKNSPDSPYPYPNLAITQIGETEHSETEEFRKMLEEHERFAKEHHNVVRGQKGPECRFHS